MITLNLKSHSFWEKSKNNDVCLNISAFDSHWNCSGCCSLLRENSKNAEKPRHKPKIQIQNLRGFSFLGVGCINSNNSNGYWDLRYLSWNRCFYFLQKEFNLRFQEGSSLNDNACYVISLYARAGVIISLMMADSVRQNHCR